ncbi:MAG: peroxidase-related enzyme [Alphaproteobacteria bacterium]|nr:peroxidase-related enzyme [Alphaproteobacteria bacterium]
MPFFPSLPASAGIGQLWSLNPSIRKPMNDLGQAIMRAESPLSPEQREFIAAFVSALNKCDYCYKGHVEMAANLGAARDEIDAAAANLDTAPIANDWRDLLRFLRKLTLEPSQMTQADADAVYAAGWNERALHDAILVCCRFNFMNRLSLGHGLDPDGVSPQARAAKMSYAQPQS